MQDAIFRLESNTVDVVLKTHPFAEILYWGPHLQHFSPQDVLSVDPKRFGYKPQRFGSVIEF